MSGTHFAQAILDDKGEEFIARRKEADINARIMKNDLEILDRIYENSDNFLARASQELKRAQRYLTFVSYLSLEGMEVVLDTDPEFPANLRRHIRSSIRQTDIISGLNNGRLCILLVETGIEGAEIVGRRLEETIRMFLKDSETAQPRRRITINKGSFPDNQTSPNTILKRMKSIIA